MQGYCIKERMKDSEQKLKEENKMIKRIIGIGAAVVAVIGGGVMISKKRKK